MNATPGPLSSPTLLLSAAAAKLTAGDITGTRTLTSQAAALALSVGDALTAGRAKSLHAQADIIDSRFSEAREWLTHAMLLLQDVGSSDDVADALAMSCYVHCVTGRDTEALKQGYQAVRLSAKTPPTVVNVKTLNYLGVALFWAGHYAQAQEAFDMSIWHAGELNSVPLAYHPMVNKACAELARVMELRYYGEACDCLELQRLLAPCLRLAHSDQGVTLGAGTGQISLLLLDSMSSIASSWAKDIDIAIVFNEACLQRAARLPKKSWLHTMALMSQVELCRAMGDLQAALLTSDSLVAQAEYSEHLQMTCAGLRLQCELLEIDGQFREALSARRKAEKVFFEKAIGNAQDSLSAAESMNLPDIFAPS